MTASFRGLTAAAPLKRIDITGNQHHRAAFRGLTAAAPLKPSPRLLFRRPCRTFRGLTAAAPLKPQGLDQGTPEAKYFPRPHRRGPIEAWSKGRAASDPESAFRGLTAAAPLKRGGAATTSSGGCAFRGLTAAAPLKLDRDILNRA